MGAGATSAAMDSGRLVAVWPGFGSDLNVSLNSSNDINRSLEQIEVIEGSDDESDVSIDEERMEALDRKMNPGDYI